MVSASWRSSSGGPDMARRRLRFASEISCVVVVMVRSGRRTRPATTQPRAVERIAISASAIADSMMSWCRSATRWVITTSPSAFWPSVVLSRRRIGGGSARGKPLIVACAGPTVTGAVRESNGDLAWVGTDCECSAGAVARRTSRDARPLM